MIKYIAIEYVPFSFTILILYLSLYVRATFIHSCLEKEQKTKSNRTIANTSRSYAVVIEKASSLREKSIGCREADVGQVTRYTGGAPGAPLRALPRRWRYYRKLPPSKEERPRCWSHRVGRLLGALPTSRNVGFTTGAPSSPPAPSSIPLSHGVVFLLSSRVFHSHHSPVRGV